jgi:hypothetical protein
VLIQWRGEPPLAATWEDVDSFVQLYPQFQLEDELLIPGKWLEWRQFGEILGAALVDANLEA